MSEIGHGASAAQSALRASLMRSGKWAGGIAAIGGFVADVLQPLAPFAAWLAIAAGLGGVAVLAALAFKFVSAERGLPALVFCAAAATVTGGLWTTQQAAAAENGILADLIPAIARLQQSIGLIEKSVERIEAKVDEIGAKTDEIAGSIEAIAAGFANLGKQGGLIADPQKPEEFYHNARIHELSGDMVNARADYLGFARFGVDAIDPYLRFATLLRVQDGRAGAREVLGELARQKPARALALAHLLQFDDAARQEKLDAFLKSNADYGPGFKFLADEYSEDRLGKRSIADKRKEGEALKAFLGFEADGRLVPSFVDQTVLADWLDDAKIRQTALGDLSGGAFAPALVIMPGGEGWTITISLPEPATAIFWRFGGTGDFTQTGELAIVDQQTGKKMPNPSFSLAKGTAAGLIEVKYTDVSGREAGPFPFAFNPDQALADSAKTMLEASWTSWLVFDASGFRGNVYFSQLASFACGIKDAAYGVNGAALSEKLVLPPCDPQRPYAIPDGFLPYFKVGEEVKRIDLQVTYADGSQSPVRRFDRGS